METKLIKKIQGIYGKIEVTKEYYDFIESWRCWYSGKVKSFHNYSQYNGKKLVAREMKSLNMAKSICEDKSDLELNEKVVISVVEVGKDEEKEENVTQKLINDVLEENDFDVRGNQSVELANALGTCAWIAYLETLFDGFKRIQIDYVTADLIIPLRVSNGRIIDCAFVTVDEQEDSKTYYVAVHELNDYNRVDENGEIEREADGYYYIYNHKFVDSKNEMNEVDIDEKIEKSVNTFSALPLFHIIKPNIVNNIDYNSGMGISLFANAIDQLKHIDQVYDSYSNEFVNGKMRTFIHDDFIQFTTEDGIIHESFNSNETEFYGINMKGDDGKIGEPIKSIAPELRAEEHQTGLNDALAALSLKIGYGDNFYEFKNGSVEKTATEVISDKGALFRTIKKDELILKKALKGLVFSIYHLLKELKQPVAENIEVSIKFDDSIIEDDGAIRKEALGEFVSGAIDRVEYFMRAYKLTKKEAELKAKEMADREPKEVVSIMGE